MHSLASSTSCRQSLKALDPDLPFLASEVAIDVDNMLSGESSDHNAMKLLSEKLSETVPTDDGVALVSRMDLATLTVLSEAITETIDQQPLKKIEDLLTKANAISKVLANAHSDSDRKELEEARDFCVALSRAAAAYSESIRDLRPSHPFRK